MLTEKQAWEYMAELWATPTVDSWQQASVTILKDDPSTGLCDCITDLWACDKITEDVHVAMTRRIAAQRAAWQIVETFLWPRDTDGAKARAEFCKTQGELC